MNEIYKHSVLKFFFSPSSLFCPGIAMVIATITGVGALTNGTIVRQSRITGGEAALAPLRPTRSRRWPTNHQSRRRRKRSTQFWRGRVELTSPLPSCAWCSSKSLTRAGTTVFLYSIFLLVTFQLISLYINFLFRFSFMKLQCRGLMHRDNTLPFTSNYLIINYYKHLYSLKVELSFHDGNSCTGCIQRHTDILNLAISMWFNKA